MKKKEGFTLVELLAVILVSARKGSIELTAKLIAEGEKRIYK